MNREELEFARKKYQKLKKENETTQAELKELLELTEDPKIKRFLHLKTKYQYNQPTPRENDDLILNAFGYAIETIEDSDIYIFVGKTREIVNVYKNLETTKEYQIYNEKEKSEFEKNHHIIKLPNCENRVLHYSYDQIEQFKKLRVWFLQELLKEENTQEEVVQKVKTLKQDEIHKILGK